MSVRHDTIIQQNTHACVFICGWDSTKNCPRADIFGLKRFCEFVQEQIFKDNKRNKFQKRYDTGRDDFGTKKPYVLQRITK